MEAEFGWLSHEDLPYVEAEFGWLSHKDRDEYTIIPWRLHWELIAGVCRHRGSVPCSLRHTKVKRERFITAKSAVTYHRLSLCVNTMCSSSDKHQKDGVVTSSGREDGSREVTSVYDRSTLVPAIMRSWSPHKRSSWVSLLFNPGNIRWMSLIT